MINKLRLLFYLMILITFGAPLSGSVFAAANSQDGQGFYYTVKEGDTLNGISEKFANSPWEKPELWSNNVYLDDSSKIYPGQVVQVFRTPSQTAMTPLVSDIVFYYPNIDGASFIRKTPVRPAGEIFRLKDRGTVAGMVNDKLKVYIAPEAQLQLGDLLTVYRQLNSTDYRIGRAVGDKYEVMAIAKVERFDGTVAEVSVVKAYKPITIGDKVVFYTPRNQEIELLPSNYEVDGIIIASDQNYSMMGSGMVAFIDKGTVDGIKPGQFYTLYETSSYVTSEPQPPTDNLFQGLANAFNPRAVREIKTHDVVGEFIVVHAELNASTVYILRSLQPIAEGTRFRAFVY